jgi:hypothetical protein
MPLAVVAAALLAPATASATDAEIQTIVRESSAKIIKAEQKAAKTGTAFDKKPNRTTLRRFRAAAREEEKLVKDIAAALRAVQPDTPAVGEGRDLMAQGLDKVETGLDRIEKALAKAAKGKEKAAKRSITKAIKEIDAGNVLIEQGEPKVGVELTPNTPQS